MNRYFSPYKEKVKCSKCGLLVWNIYYQYCGWCEGKHDNPDPKDCAYYKLLRYKEACKTCRHMPCK